MISDVVMKTTITPRMTSSKATLIRRNIRLARIRFHRLAAAHKSGGHLGPPLRNLLRPLQLYEDLYLTEQPYGLVCGVETVLPANDWSNAALT